LTVTQGNGCTTPLVPPNATKTEVAKGTLCLACSVNNPDNLIDDDRRLRPDERDGVRCSIY